MSGVVCVFARDRAPVDDADVEAVLERQAHRGPDGLTLWCDGQVGLGYAALDPTGVGRSTGPLLAEGGRLAIVGDLRIDNRRELINGLDLQDSGVCDAEIVLEAYRLWGADVAVHLEGGFAFAVWDARRQRVFCARDHLGVKPFTYHLSRELFVCASEAEAVPCHRRVSRRINDARIADFLVSELEGIDHTSTFFEGVERLPPAHFLVVDCDGQRLRRYWQPDPGNELRLDSDEAYAEAFSETFRQTVGSCLTGVAAPGLLLSGVIDSAAVRVFAGALAEDGEVGRLTSYSATDEENDPSSETAHILAMIKHLGVGARTFSTSAVAGMSPQTRRSLLDCGEPFDSCMVVDRLLFSLAAEEGCRTVLDGVDGDIVASSSVPIIHLLRRGNVLVPWREAAARRRLFPDVSHPLRVLAGGALRAWLPSGLRRFARQLRNRRSRVADAIEESLIDEKFALKVDVADRLEQLWNYGGDGPGDDPFVAHARAVTHPYVAVALERYDRVAARCGVGVRHPFFDLRLVRLCLSLPWDLKVRRGWAKFILRLATDGRVPEPVRWRRDFGHVLWRPASRVIAEERAFLEFTLNERKSDLNPYVDLERLKRTRNALGGNPTVDDEVWIWEAATLATWLTRIHG